MKNYSVEIIESYRHVIEIKATTEDIALRKAQKSFENHTGDYDFSLSDVNFNDADFNILREIKQTK